MHERRFDDPLVLQVLALLQSGDVSALRQLMRTHPSLIDARVIDEHGTRKTWLHCAHDWPGHRPGIARMTRYLVEAGVPIDAPAVNPTSEARETALHWAASSDDAAGVEALLACGADIEAEGAVLTGGTAMSDAVIFQQWNAAAALLDHGAKTQPFEAAGLGLLERLQPIEELSEAARNAALWHAARNGHAEVVTALVTCGADPDHVGPMDKTPRQIAIEAGHDLFDPTGVSTWMTLT